MKALPLVVACLALTGCSTLDRHNGAVGGVNYLTPATESSGGLDKHITGCKLGNEGELILTASGDPVASIYPDKHAVMHTSHGDVSFPGSSSVKLSLDTDAKGHQTGHVEASYEQGNETLNLGAKVHDCSK